MWHAELTYSATVVNTYPYIGVAVCDVGLPVIRPTLTQVCGVLINVCCCQRRVVMATDLAYQILMSYMYYVDADVFCNAVRQWIGEVTDNI